MKPPRRVTSAHLVAFLALFVALGGGAYAVTALPRNSVGAPQLKRGAVTPPKLAKSALKQLRGKTGPQGIPGLPGAAGQPGATGPSDVYIGGSSVTPLTASRAVVASISVPPGDYLLGGKVTLFSSATGAGGGADCLLAPTAAGGVGTWDGAYGTWAGVAAQTGGTTLSLSGADHFASEQAIVLVCKTDFATTGTITSDDARVWAVRTGAAHGPPLPID
jgi:hypothetical protein